MSADILEEFQKLVGKTLDQICFGKYQLKLNFSDSFSLVVECLWSVNNSKRDVIAITDLVGSGVSTVNYHEHNGIEIVFDNVAFRVLEFSKQYENITLQGNGTLLVL